MTGLLDFRTSGLQKIFWTSVLLRLISSKQVAGVDFFLDIVEAAVVAVGDDGL